ncbi:GDSL-type esterase/lipase family protein [Cytophagaceae bacterium YF14B1]|uniref:GDSL-type esterase/lipase family protein n=1 Tax=Xanthocytophaga flava TaxID=3048013 RepID=A0AAE3QK58_9BACT|nr:GDSL-type esterase/lipase family protein [Xanthocytophaga flavus]MDJ1468808.1 GDSL-type esterase/lipase family protein [Xanthocytophaga flavus]MDJ1480096.1 GDSL-type esterase/lipase family protein [Xanthocytophaga flavus]
MTQKIVWGLLALSLLLSSFSGKLPVSSIQPYSSKAAKAASAYPFIKQDKNQIITYQGESMKYFYASLDSLSHHTKQKVNVIHIGDSHIQADFFSGHLREMLQADTLFGNGGRGLVFPYNAVRTNAPDNLKIAYTGIWEGCRNISRDKSCNWGLAGITATTYSPVATLTIDPTTKAVLPYSFTKVRIFFDTRDSTNFLLKILNQDTPLNIKLEDGYAILELPRPTTTITLGFEKSSEGQNHFTLQGIALENDQPGIQYHSAGVNGAEVTSVLRMPSLEKNMAVLKPDLVIISLGTNDAFRNLDTKLFKRNYGELIQRIRRASPHTSILLTTPGDNLRGKKYVNPDNAKAVKIMNELAEETGVAVWDFYEVMGGLQSIKRWYVNKLAAYDKVHLTQHGYMLQAELLYDALLNDYETYKHNKEGRPLAAGGGK